jgi:hypothetical protein
MIEARVRFITDSVFWEQEVSHNTSDKCAVEWLVKQHFSML